MVSIVRDGGAG